jgi:hypothetical protein
MNMNIKALLQVARQLLVLFSVIFMAGAFAQTPSTSTSTLAIPSLDATCVVSALNRNAPMDSGNSYFLIPGVPSGIGPYRVRAVCSDGTVGQTAPADFTKRVGSVIDLGNVKWGQVDPIPLSIELTGPSAVSFSDQVAYKLMAKFRDGSTKDVTAAVNGAGYNLTPLAWWGGQSFATIASPSSSAYGDTLSADGKLILGAGNANSNQGGYQLLVTATYEGIAVAKAVKVGAWSGIQGLVTLPDGVTLVAGAKVQIQRIAPSLRSPETVVTDANGRYASASTPIGDYKINVIDANGARGFATANLNPGSIANVNIALNGNGDLNVNVVGANAQPVAGAQVVITHGQVAGQAQSALASVSGLATFLRFMSGPINVTVRDPATGAVGSAKVNLLNAGTSNVTVVLQPVAAIFGRVLAADGVQPVAGVQVRLLSVNKGVVSQVLSAADGVFRFDTLPLADSPYSLQAYQGSQLQASSANLVLASAGQQLQQDLVFGTIAATGGSVAGRVVDQDANPYANADLSLSSATGQPVTLKTDAAGNYFLGSVPAGSFTVAASSANYAGQASGVIASNGAAVTLNFQVTAVGEVRGQVVSSLGQPVANAVVELVSASGIAVQRGATNASGQYVIAQVPVGGFSISVLDTVTLERGLASDFLSAAGESRNVNMSLGAVGTVRVTISSGGVPFAGAKVGLTTQGKFSYGQTLVSDATGIAEFMGVPQGAFSISAVGKSGQNAVIAGRIRGVLTATQANINLTLGSSYAGLYTVAGRVLSASGVAVPNALVRLSSRDMPTGGTVPIPNSAWDEYGVTSDASGNFSFNDLWLNDDGRGRLKLDALIGGVLRGRVIVGNAAANLGLKTDIVLFGAGTLVGNVSSANGRKLINATVQGTHADTYLFSPSEFIAYTNNEGRYALSSPAGSLQVQSNHGGYSSSVNSINVVNGVTQVVNFSIAIPTEIRVNAPELPAGTLFHVTIDGRYYGEFLNGAVVGYVPDGPHVVELVLANGERITQNISTTDATNGVLSVGQGLKASLPKIGVLNFGAERHLYSIPMQAGDVLSVSVHGDASLTGKAAYIAKANVFDGLGTRIASGYGYGSAFNYQQYDELGDLKQVTASTAGNYAVQVQNYYTDDYYAGGYYLTFKLNGQAVAVQALLGGGAIQGNIKKPDGSNAVDQVVEIWAARGQSADLVTRVKTDANGAYRFAPVPLGEVSVKGIAANTTLASGTTTVGVAGDTGTVNLVLAKLTTLNVNVRVSSNGSPPYYANFVVGDDQGERENYVYFNGSFSSNTVTLVAVGDNITVKTTHPYNALLYVERIIAGEDGQTKNVELVLASGRVTGRVVDTSGAPLSGMTVKAYRADGTSYLTSAITDSQGVFDMPALAAGQNIRLVAIDTTSGVSAASDVIPLEGQSVAVPDMVLTTGSMQGRVLYSDLTPVSNLTVFINTPNGYTLYAWTDALGTYQFPSLPVGQSLVVGTYHPSNYSLASVTVTVAGSAVTTAPDLVFSKFPTLFGKVRNSSGVAIPNAFVALYTATFMTACDQANRGADTSYLSLMNDGIVTARTDAAGNYRFKDLPEDQSFTLISAINTARFCEEAVAMPVQPLQLGEDRQITDLVYPDRTGALGSLVVKVVNGLGTYLEIPDGLVNQCPLTVRLYGASGLMATDSFVHNVNGYRFADVPYGDYSVDISTWCLADTFTSASIAITSTTEKLLPVVIPVVAGKVTEFSGAAVAYPNITLVQDKGIDKPADVFYGNSDDQGNYIIVNSMLGTGTYILTASGGSLGFSKSITGTFTTTPFLVQDIQLPGGATMSGRVLTSSGATPGFGYLRIVNSALPDWERFDYMGGGGIGNNLTLPFGKNTIYFAAQDPAFNYSYSYASVEVLVNNNFDPVALGDIHLLPFGALEVNTLNQAGSAVEGNREVRINSAQMESYFSNVSQAKTSDLNGKAQFVLPAMAYSVALISGSGEPAGFKSTSVNGGNTTTVSVARSGSLLLGWTNINGIDGLVTDDGVSFVLTDYGSLSTATSSTSNYYDIYFEAGPALKVDGLDLPRNVTAQWMTSDRELQIGPYYKGNALKVLRRMYVPSVGGYARLMDSFTNLSTQTISINFSDTAPNRGSSKIMVPQTALATHLIFVSTRFSGDAIFNPTLVGTIYGDGTSLKPEVLFNAPSDLLRWSVPIPAGQTVSVLKFHILNDIDLTTAQNKANQIVNKTMINMFEGLSAADKQSVKNFSIQP